MRVGSLLPGLTTVLAVEGRPEQTWRYERGMAQFFEFMLQGRELVAPLFSGEKYYDEKAAADFAAAFTAAAVLTILALITLVLKGFLERRR